MHMRLARHRFVYLIALLFVVAPLNAFAAAEAQYSEQELRAYAFANASVRLIQGGLDRQLIDAANDQQASQELQSEAQAQMNAALQRAGLTAGEYEAITEQVTADTELAATVQDYVDEEMGIVR
jgi:hypothetical protein